MRRGVGWAEPGRRGRSLRSVTLVRVLSIYNFNVSEGEEAAPPVHLPLPLAVHVHPGHLYDVADLEKQGKGGGGLGQSEIARYSKTTSL